MTMLVPAVPTAFVTVSLSLSLMCELTGCSRLFFPAPIPMRAVDYPAPRANASCLIVFLPGMGDAAEDFQKHGFVDEFRRRNLAVDLVAADATFGYYSRGIMVDRLSRDVIQSRQRRGYAHTWLIGPSMGGLGTFIYSHAHPADIAGVVALAPFLGDREIIDEIRDAGGLARWSSPPDPRPVDESNYQRDLWRWLQLATRGETPAPAMYMGFGMKDKLGAADELLAVELPKDHVYRVPGGHSWDPWRAILVQFLDRGVLANACH